MILVTLDSSITSRPGHVLLVIVNHVMNVKDHQLPNVPNAQADSIIMLKDVVNVTNHAQHAQDPKRHNVYLVKEAS